MKNLSRLQKTILLLAQRNPGHGKVDVCPADVKVGYYGFPLRPKGSKILFNRNEIGRSRYNTASVNIARAFEHLVRKGLAERSYYGINLTGIGRKAAARIKKANF